MHTEQKEEKTVEVQTIIDLARGYERGQNLIEIPSASGGILVDDETSQLAADMELVLSKYQEVGKEKTDFFSDLLQVLERASDEESDPIEEVRSWLEAWLAD